MKAARLHEYGKPLVVEEVPTPGVGDTDVLVKIEGAGFCHSDLHVIDGEIQVLPRLPLILGHENAGTVVEVGRAVQAVKPGDHVAVYGGWGCGSCRYCITGNEQLCLHPQWVGLSQHDGGYAEYLRVPHERYLVKLERVSPREAAVYTDAALTPYRAVKRAMPFLAPDGWALVIGVGGLGQFGIKLLRALSAVRIIAVDIDDSKLQLAAQYGAEYTFNGRRGDVARAILDLTEGVGVQAAFDFVGAASTLELAIATAAAGAKVTQLGLAGGAANIQVMKNSRFEVLFEATLWGNLKELREVIALAESGRLTPIQLEFYPLDRIGEVYRKLKEGRIAGRAVIVP